MEKGKSLRSEGRDINLGLSEDANLPPKHYEESQRENSGAIKKKVPVKTSKQNDSKDVNNSKSNPRSSKIVQKKKSKQTDGTTIDVVSSQKASSTVRKTDGVKKKPSPEIHCLYDDSWPRLNSPDNMRNVSKSGKSIQSDKGKFQKLPESVERCQTPRQDKKTYATQATSKLNTPKSLPNTPEFRSAQKSFRKKTRSPQKSMKFEPYIPLSEVQQGLKRGEFIEGALRINPRNYEDSYVSSPDGQMDIYIGGIKDRNRALNGDLVVVQVNPKQEWKVLCDAIKDYQERYGQNILEPVCSPVPSTPCKIHTPEKFHRDHQGSTSSWDGTGGERFPDTLEILGVDKLAEQFNQITVESKKKNRSKRYRVKLRNKSSQPDDDDKKESSSQKSSGTSFSQDSSEDYLSKYSSQNSPDFKDEALFADPGCSNSSVHENPESTKLCTNTINCGIDEQNTNHVSDNNIKSSPNVHDTPLRDISEHCEHFESELQNNVLKQECDNPWVNKEASLNLVISPEQLLDFEDGNSLQLQNNQYGQKRISISDDGSSDGECIIVPPDDLSGDAFSDSASTGSSYHNIDQVLEDAAFFASQQDAQNNNTEDSYDDNSNTPLNQEFRENNEYPYDSVITAMTSATLKEKNISGYDCKMQQNDLSVCTVNVCSDSIVCPAVCSTEIGVRKEVNIVEDGNSSDEKRYDVFSPTVSCEPSTPMVNVAHVSSCNKSTKRNEKPKKEKKRNQKRGNKEKPLQSSEVNAENVGFRDVKSLTVEEVMKHPLWPKFVQKTGKVVYVIERKHSCVAAGHIKLLQDRNPNWALFSPNDYRLPRVMVPMFDCPPGFFQRSSDFTKVLFIAVIDEWKEDATFATGRLVKSVGNAGEIEPETEGILLEYGVDYEEFPEEVIDCLPESKNWTIPDVELKNRYDFRSQCVFTIDPATARDMDDAVSCELLENGNFVIGVHIADVTHFVHEGTALDDFAKSRATSVYLVQRVVPMLPRVLCDDLCSLTPGQERLTFSVLWEMTEKGEIVKEWFTRSVIMSCIKMSYEHAQDMIETPSKTWNSSEHPTIYGEFTISDIAKRVFQLHLLAVKLREKRFIDGALRLDQTKLQFTLDRETGLPSGFYVFEQRDSNRLIEEFMLLANMTVARQIYTTYPELALLRRHPPPQLKPMDDVVSSCALMGIHLDASSSGALQASISRYFGDDILSQARGLILTHLCSKPMNCALYFCTGVLDDVSLFHHYALSVPLYTHFTSPIRRYPDVIVHRLLGASLGYSSLPETKPTLLQKCAEHCNDKKYSAKRVSEMSSELFLAAFIRESGPTEQKAMVIGVMDHSFDCLILSLGIVKRVYCDKLALIRKEFKKVQCVPTLKLIWKDEQQTNGVTQVIVMFSIVDVKLTAGGVNSLRILCELKMPSKYGA